MKKRVFGLLLSCMLLIGMLSVGAVSASAACSATVTVSSAYGAKGDVVEVTVSITEMSYLVNADMTLAYDPTKLEPDWTYYANPDDDESTLCYQVNTEMFTNSWMHAGNVKEEGKFLMLVASSSHSGLTMGGEMFRVAFRIIDNDVESAALTFTAKPVMANDQSGTPDEFGYPVDTPLDLTVVNGEIEIEQPALLGDTNGDGVVDMIDAFKVYSAASNGTGAEELLATADMNGDGGIDMIDAFAVYRIASGS